MENRMKAEKGNRFYWGLYLVIVAATLMPAIGKDTVYCLKLLAIQVGTLLAARLFFGGIFAKAQTKLPIFFGVLLYMTSPYRMYICYGLENFSQAVVWALLPIYAWAASGVMGGSKSGVYAVVAAVALAGIGYTDAIFFVIVLGITVFVGIVARRLWIFASMAGGMILFFPVLNRLIRYLFLDEYQELGVPLRSIMPEGYRVGQFFSVWLFRDGHPGMGLGMLICLLAMIWLWFVEGDAETDRKYPLWMAAGGFFMMIATRYFPWEMVQRLGMWALKAVCMVGTPAIFWGMAFLCFCIPAAHAMEKISRHENRWIAAAVPFVVMIAAVGICVYQCSAFLGSHVV